MEELWRTKKIDDAADVRQEDITMANLAILFRTGCSEVSGSGVGRVVHYRQGLATALGNIRREAWISLATRAVEKELGREFYEKTVAFVLANGTPVQKQDAEVEALDICTARLFEREAWTGHQLFQRFVGAGQSI